MDKNLTVCLDNGHGNDTKGKRSPDGRLLEYEYNRIIVSRVGMNLSKRGIPVFIVTPELHDISLTARCKRVNNIWKSTGRNCILFSVHVNAAKNSGWHNATGWSVWTSKGQTGGDKLADQVYLAAKEVLLPLGKSIRTDYSDRDPDYEENFTVLSGTSCPAVITENFFMDTRSDVDWLLSEEGKTAITDIHIKAVENYINSL